MLPPTATIKSFTKHATVMPINYKDYPANWEELRDAVLLRDGYCCKDCGIPQYGVGYRHKDPEQFTCLVRGWTALEGRVLKDYYQPLYPQKVILIILTVAHLDHDEWNEAVSLDRLAALCQRCHLEYDREDNELRKRYGKRYRRDQLALF